nr:hypothetical protein Itr_chr04CG17940 [Ipomoea trifida]
MGGRDKSYGVIVADEDGIDEDGACEAVVVEPDVAGAQPGRKASSDAAHRPPLATPTCSVLRRPHRDDTEKPCPPSSSHFSPALVRRCRSYPGTPCRDDVA